MSGLATVTIFGNLVADPETRQVGDGSVLSFRVAVNQKRGREEAVDYYACSIWGKRGEAVGRFLERGKPVCVSGTLTTRQYEARDGQQRTSLEVRVDGFAFGGGASGGQRGGFDDGPPPASGGGGGFGDDDSLPF